MFIILICTGDDGFLFNEHTLWLWKILYTDMRWLWMDSKRRSIVCFIFLDIFEGGYHLLGLSGWYHSNYPKEWLLSQIKGRVIVLRDRIHKELGN